MGRGGFVPSPLPRFGHCFAGCQNAASGRSRRSRRSTTQCRCAARKACRRGKSSVAGRGARGVGGSERPANGSKSRCSIADPSARAERVRVRVRICLGAVTRARARVGRRLSLAALAFLTSRWIWLLRQSLQAHCAGGGERLPHRQLLEQEWTMRMWGAPPRGDRIEFRVQAGCSALGRQADLLRRERIRPTPSLMLSCI